MVFMALCEDIKRPGLFLSENGSYMLMELKQQQQQQH